MGPTTCTAHCIPHCTAASPVPPYCRFLYDRAQCHMDAGDHASAIADMSAALVLLRDCASLRYSRGMAYFGMGQYESALEVRAGTGGTCSTRVGAGGTGWGLVGPDRRQCRLCIAGLSCLLLGLGLESVCVKLFGALC